MNNLTGKDNSLEELIAENQPRLKAFIRKRVSTKEDAEDILQDVLYQLVKTIESTFNPIEQVTAWLYRVARNTIINKGKKIQEEELPVSSYDKEDNVLSEFSEVLFSDAPPTPEIEYMRSLVWQELETALARATTRITGSIRTIGNGRIVSQRSCQYHRNISQHFIITKILCRHSPSQTAERTV